MRRTVIALLRPVLSRGLVVLALNSLFLVASFVIPGVLLLGTATYQYGIPDTLQRRGRQLVVAFGVLLVLAVAAGAWQYLGNAGLAGTSRAQLTGLVFAPLFAVAFLLALRGPLRGPLAAVFEPRCLTWWERVPLRR